MQSLLNIMTSQTALRPFNPAKKKTFLVTDASPFETEAWVPIDIYSTSFTSCEQNYHQIEKNH